MSSSATGTWPFPERFRLSWKAGAVLLRLPSVLFGTRLLKWTQKVQVKNGQRLVKAVMDRPKGTPLVTVTNHLSYIDAPSFYHLLPLRSLFSERKVKWTPSAEEICFTNRISSAYFSRCHAVPVIRGQGVYQRGVDFLIRRLNEGHWIHFYPEGVINYDKPCGFHEFFCFKSQTYSIFCMLRTLAAPTGFVKP
jgi:monolysocardiolipin acyltransferase